VKLTEDQIRKITLNAIEELGDAATPQNVKNVVAKSIEKMGEIEDSIAENETSSGRLILTSFGMNHPGIVAAITKSFSGNSCDILDISQKIMTDFYTMIMIVDITKSPKDLKGIQEDMNSISDELKIKIYLQHEDVFKYMHRI
jgi:ACT domain-containing protein